MFKRKLDSDAKGVSWNVESSGSANLRAGPAGRESKPAAPANEARESGWLQSSWELSSGLQVSEKSMDTLPPELVSGFGALDAPRHTSDAPPAVPAPRAKPPQPPPLPTVSPSPPQRLRELLEGWLHARTNSRSLPSRPKRPRDR